MSNQKSVLKYDGVSTMQPSDDGQKLTLLGAKDRSEPFLSFAPKDAVSFREGLSTFLDLNMYDLEYEASPEMAEQGSSEYTEVLDRLNLEMPHLSAIERRQRFFSFLKEYDPTSWVPSDPVVEIQPDGIGFELFRKRGAVYSRLFIKREAYEVSGDPVYGETNLEFSSELYQSLQLVNGSSPLNVEVGAKASGHGEDYTGELTKEIPIPLWWNRALLQLHGFSTLKGRCFQMTRMDLYNILRFLRLKKEVSPKNVFDRPLIEGKGRSLQFSLAPGKPPEIILWPWDWRYKCTADLYDGPSAEVIGTWDRKQLWIFDRLLPYVKTVSVQVLGIAQPTFWTLDCGDFTFTLGLMGFKVNLNWSKDIQMDQQLIRHAPEPSGFAAVLDALKAKPASVGTLATQLSLPENQVRLCLRRASQNGEALLDIANQQFRSRQWFQEPLDCESYHFRDEEERQAYGLAGPTLEDQAAALGLEIEDVAELFYHVGGSLERFSRTAGMPKAFVHEALLLSKSFLEDVAQSCEEPLSDVLRIYRWLDDMQQLLQAEFQANVDKFNAVFALLGEVGDRISVADEKGFVKKCNENMDIAFSVKQAEMAFDLICGGQQELQRVYSLDVPVIQKVYGYVSESAKELVQRTGQRRIRAAKIYDQSREALSRLAAATGFSREALAQVLESPDDPDSMASALGLDAGSVRKVLVLTRPSRIKKVIEDEYASELNFAESTVTEPPQDGHSSEPQYKPVFAYSSEKGMRRPGCDCEFYKLQTSGNKKPCSHLKALWLQHCRDNDVKRIAFQVNPSLIEEELRFYVKRGTVDVEQRVELKKKRLFITWGPVNIDESKRRKTDMQFATVAAARKAYLSHLKKLQRKGYLDASAE
jgi:hypothetical protein